MTSFFEIDLAKDEYNSSQVDTGKKDYIGLKLARKNVYN